MNTYRTTSGERIAKSIIDRKISEAKREKINKMLKEYGYIFCEECGRNTNSGIPIDCSHTISVDEAQKMGNTELSWSIDNLKMRCRICHRIHDKNNLNYTENESIRERLCAGKGKIRVTGKFRIA